MRAFTAAEAAHTIAPSTAWPEMLEKHGETPAARRRIFLSGEQVRPIPRVLRRIPQLENGVGMTALLEHEFAQALALRTPPPRRAITIATGMLAPRS
jgi:hypothetical protein